MPKFLTPIDLTFNELQNFLVQNIAGDAGTGLVDGRVWYDSTADVFKGRANGATITFSAAGPLNAEEVQDIVGAMTVGGIESGITVVYDDTSARLDFTVTDAPLLGGQNSAFHLARANHTGTQAPSTVLFAATDKLLGRDTAAGGAGEEIGVTGGLVFDGGGNIQTTAFTGDVTKALGGTALTIANSVVTNAKLANMAANSFKGNNTGGAAVALDLTVAQVKTLLAYNGTEIVFTPTGNIASTNVSAALAELETDLTALINTTVEARTWKDPVDAATTAALPALTYNSGAGTLTATANAALAAQDGITLVAGEDLLVKNQASTFQHGIYTITQVGSGAAPFILTRRADSNTAVELRDATVIIEAGSTQKGDIYTQTASALADLTAAAQTWVQTGEGNTTYTADATTIELIGNSFRIATGAAGNGLMGGGGAALAVATGTGLEISADTVRIAAAAAGNGLTGGAGAALAVGAGTGIVVAATTVGVDTAVVTRKFVADVGDAAATVFVLTHNLGTRDVWVAVHESATPWAGVFPDWEATSTNTVTLRFTTAPTSAQYRALVLA